MIESRASGPVLELISCNCRNWKCSTQSCVCIRICGCINSTNDGEEDGYGSGEDKADEDFNDENCECCEVQR